MIQAKIENVKRIFFTTDASGALIFLFDKLIITNPEKSVSWAEKHHSKMNVNGKLTEEEFLGL